MKPYLEKHLLFLPASDGKVKFDIDVIIYFSYFSPITNLSAHKEQPNYL